MHAKRTSEGGATADNVLFRSHGMISGPVSSASDHKVVIAIVIMPPPACSGVCSCRACGLRCVSREKVTGCAPSPSGLVLTVTALPTQQKHTHNVILYGFTRG